jgi:hypothetical protein
MVEKEPTWSQWLKNHEATDVVTFTESFGQQPWNPSAEDREAAWILYTEIRTRIATQSLHYRSGDEETALDSLYKLFDITRKTIEDNGPQSRQVAAIAIHVLNTHIRPLTAKWHKKKIAGRLLNDDDRREFRRELGVVQQRLTQFCRLLASIAEGDAFQGDTVVTSVKPPLVAAAPGADIPFDRLLFAKSPPGVDQLFSGEHQAICRRRAVDQESGIKNLVGLACSGGGIRSATFCLGVVQSLAPRGLLREIDYLSTVSGGGYFGSFLSSYLNDPDRSQVSLEPGKLPFAEAGQAEPAPIRQLRNNSKYLLKGGLLGQSRMAGLLLFGTLVNLLTLLPVLFSTLTFAKILQSIGFGAKDFHEFIGTVLTGLVIVLAILLAGLPIVYQKWVAKRESIARYENFTIVTALTLLAVWALGWFMPWTYQSLRAALGSASNVFWLFLSLPVIFAGSAFAVGQDRFAGRVLFSLAGVSGPVLLLATYFVLNDAWDAGFWQIILLLGISVGLVWWLWGINANQISPHRYYRNRLAETYLIRRGVDGSLDPQPLTQLRSNNPTAPYHLINAAVNLPGSTEAELRGRNSDFFLFTEQFCGSPLLGYCPTKDLEAKDPHLDLGTAMAISGAAASAHMGTATIKGLEYLMSLLNIRLGYWLPNPKRLQEVPGRVGVRPFALWRELFGRIDEHGKFVNLSDGGHIENLGIYELLRRRCKFVIAIDGEADPDMRFSGLMTLIRYAEIDFGIRIRVDLADLARNEAGYCKAHFVLGTIQYNLEHTGYLLYIKSSLTGNERDYILDYQQKCPAFPHETTADQFFSEPQFEAYRALGNHIGQDLLSEEFAPGGQPLTIEDWFRALVEQLLGQRIAVPPAVR